jgi:hypothetical protein
MTKMGRLIEGGMRAGHLLAVEGGLPSPNGARARLSNDMLSVTDGPFTEAKEVIGGLAFFKRNRRKRPSNWRGIPPCSWRQ